MEGKIQEEESLVQLVHKLNGELATLTRTLDGSDEVRPDDLLKAGEPPPEIGERMIYVGIELGKAIEIIRGHRDRLRSLYRKV